MLKQQPLPGFEQVGSIVNITSLCATNAVPGLPAYSASKGGLWGMSKVDALDYGPAKIRVNCVAPGNTFTPMLAGAMGPEHGKHYASITPLRRLGRTEDIANAVVFLAGPRAAYIHTWASGVGI
jgi:NAD(P)-dependent dehydrogenase (short-subunit alcohol dehydrogenase family)